MTNYQHFAQVYDEVMDQTVYDRWLSYTQNKLTNIFGTCKEKKLLELACGTGEIAIRLQQIGCRVSGMDLSENMLTLAQQKAHERGVEINWLQGDMCDFLLEEPVQCVTLFSDSLCYLIEKQDVQHTFNSVAHALTEDGIFLFDVHSTYQMNEVFPGYQYVYTTDKMAFVWESFALSNPNMVEHVITMFLRNETQTTYQRHEEVHIEKSFEVEEYLEMLALAGFQQVEVTAEFGESEVHETSPRWFFCCRKTEELN